MPSFTCTLNLKMRSALDPNSEHVSACPGVYKAFNNPFKNQEPVFYVAVWIYIFKTINQVIKVHQAALEKSHNKAVLPMDLSAGLQIKSSCICLLVLISRGTVHQLLLPSVAVRPFYMLCLIPAFTTVLAYFASHSDIWRTTPETLCVLWKVHNFPSLGLIMVFNLFRFFHGHLRCPNAKSSGSS